MTPLYCIFLSLATFISFFSLYYVFLPRHYYFFPLSFYIFRILHHPSYYLSLLPIVLLAAPKSLLYLAIFAASLPLFHASSPYSYFIFGFAFIIFFLFFFSSLLSIQLLRVYFSLYTCIKFLITLLPRPASASFTFSS